LKVSKLIPKIIGHPKNNYFYIVKIHENTYSAASIGQKRLGTTYPSMVGSVIVYENRIIGKAGIKKRGTACRSKCNQFSKRQIPIKATIYVSLEPCSHFGKTPPVLI
jgi:diaminohydroxyphosphoribosylaminopyrimidine deaminase/5-amino-6-(5-phosphoribosylamino)uracil reductase